MSFKKLKKDDLELMSYTDIANLILESEKQLTTKDLFEKIINSLELDYKDHESKIGNFYTSLTTDKRFILIDGVWDLKKNHATGKLLNDEDIEDIDEIDTDDPTDDSDEVDIFADENDEDLDDVTEEYKNLVIVDEEDLDIEQ